MVVYSVNKESAGAHHSTILPRLLSVTLFCVILATGLAIFKDYGISIDEPPQRTHSLVNYRYINVVLWHRNITQLRDLPALGDDQSNIYSMASQLPLVGIEALYYFTLDSRTIYLFRHLYTFLLYFVSLVCFYFICLTLFKNPWYALLGSAMLWLYPRFFAESFYNIKDLVFVAFYIMTLFCLLKVLTNKRRLFWSICFALACALAINTRIMGVMLLMMLSGCMLLQDVWRCISAKRSGGALPGARQLLTRILPPYVAVLGGTLLFYILITPASWQSPFHYVTTSFVRYSNFDMWDDTVLFSGLNLTNLERPWYYIPVWMGITVPIVYLVMFMAGNFYLGLRTLRPGSTRRSELYLTWTIALFFWVAAAALIILHIKIYNAWRHVYFLFIPFLLIAIYGLKTLVTSALKYSLLRYLPVLLVVVSLVYQTGWIIINHPYQYVYFNAIGRPIANRFERDYWCVSLTDLYRYILSTYQPEKTVVYCPTGCHTELLTSSQRQHLQMLLNLAEGDPHPDFIVEAYGYPTRNAVVHTGYIEDHSIWVDGFRVATVFVDENYPGSRH
jgi:hypothetical protein